MDIISQLQEQVNTIAALAFNTFGTLQRDAHPVKLSPNYPDPPPPSNPTEDPATATGNVSEQPKLMTAALVKAAKQVPLSLSHPIPPSILCPKFHVIANTGNFACLAKWVFIFIFFRLHV